MSYLTMIGLLYFGQFVYAKNILSYSDKHIVKQITNIIY